MWPALLALLVTGAGAGRAEPWRDELATWSAASRPMADLIRMVGHIDAVTAPYYLFMHAWLRVAGDSPTAMRLPSILCAAGTAGLTAVLGRRLFDGRVGLVAGLLFAVLPATSRYAQEARPYAFATLFAVVATLLLVLAVDRPGGRRWAAYGAALLGLALTSLLATTLVVGHAVGVSTTGRRALPGWAVTVLAVVVLASPLAVLGLRQRGQQLGWLDQASVGGLPGLPGSVFGAPAVGGLLVGLAALGWASRGRSATLLAASVLGPLVLLFVAGRFTPLFAPRYLVFTAPLLCLLAAAAIAPARLPAALSIVAVAAFLGAPAQRDLRRTHEWPRSEPRGYAAAARVVGAHGQPGDGVVYPVRDDWSFLDTAITYHLGARAPRDVLCARSAARRGSLWATECAVPSRCLAGVDRIWVLAVGQPADPLRPMPPAKAAAVRDGYAVTGTWSVPDITVWLLTRRDGVSPS
ncbi:glycosyltransferase family 39 protein [Plantactinospora sp. GCM10030261]|uniref:glycosyltransferase family 39 protein n=1 Tax=Plantactinospora sp. GCM10030261 TaxID=3273420 RepID=UPI0036139842